jgi:CBS domain-containing protein
MCGFYMWSVDAVGENQRTYNERDVEMLRAKDVMTQDVVTTRRETGVYEAVRILLKHHIAGLPVVDDDGTLVGILTEKDVLGLYESADYGRDRTVEDYMTQPAVHFDEDESLEEICRCLMRYTFRRVPVTSDGKVVGILSRPDIIRWIVELSGESVTAAEEAS